MDLKPLEESWSVVLQDEFRADYFKKLIHTVQTEIKEGKLIYQIGRAHV